MKFINRGKSIKIRKGNLKHPNWITLKTGEITDLPEYLGRNNNLEEVTDLTDESKQVLQTTEGQIGDKKVETKQIENISDVYFFDKLVAIKGIGDKIAKDIVKVYELEENLIEAVYHGEELPFRDDVEKLLRREYGN